MDVRLHTEARVQPLTREDMVIQTMMDVSPTKWHLAHSSWFYERFILRELSKDYEPYHVGYEYLFNSYYNHVGPQHCRPRRGQISRPTVDQVYTYRSWINNAIVQFILNADDATYDQIQPRLILGLHHEMQHQELIVTDIKHVLSSNPLLPGINDDPQDSDTQRESWASGAGDPTDGPNYIEFDKTMTTIGYREGDAPDGFAFDHEKPQHEVLIHPYALADRLVTHAEYRQFVESGGYEQHQWWLSEGFAKVQAEGWKWPLYWYWEDADRKSHTDPDEHAQVSDFSNGRWMQYTLLGPRPVMDHEPVSHLSYFEADAYARWAGARLPSELEWEHAARSQSITVHAATQPPTAHAYHPAPTAGDRTPFDDMFGQLWQWTSSSFNAYPGFKKLSNALGEYNGKFMCNQYVLRGSSCATPHHHSRISYRNFFPADARWQFTGIRLAQTIES